MFRTLHFNFKLIPSLFIFVLCALFISLGIWQIHRAKEKEALLSQLTQQRHQKPLTLAELATVKKTWQYRTLRASGMYDNQQQFLVDNKFYRDEVGYHVITPMKILGEKHILLVNRGWIPAGESRNKLPHLQSISGLQTIHGIIQAPLRKPFLLGKQEQQNGTWPYRIEGIDLQIMEEKLKQPVFPFILLLDPDNQYGFVRQWEFVTLLPQNHIAYAVQWFALSFALLLVYCFANLKRDS